MSAPQNIAVIGASGGIGGAILDACKNRYGDANIQTLSRSAKTIDIVDEASVAAAARRAGHSLDLVIVATGMLHGANIAPEKSLRDLDTARLEEVFRANAIGPALVMKHFLPLMRKKERSVFAALSARVGSISDNYLGGWYSYRASKAALNQLIRTAAIEQARKHPHCAVIGLHPGTVDTDLSRPFQGNVPEGKLFTPDFTANALLDVTEQITPAQTGRVFAWDGVEVPA